MFMKSSRQDFIDKGWSSVGSDDVVEYLAKENEHDEIVYVTIYNGFNTCIPQTIDKNLVKILSDFASK